MSKLGNTTLREKMSKEVTAVMMARSPDLPVEKAQAKVKSAFGWWAACGLFATGASFICWKVIEAATKGVAVPTLLALLGIGLPALVSLYCANKASGEATKAFLEMVKDLVTFWRKKDSA